MYHWYLHDLPRAEISIKSTSRNKACCHIDNILITGETREDHLKNLDEFHMQLKVEKCLFQQKA